MIDIFRNVSDQALQYKVNNIPGLLIFPDEFIWPDEAGNEEYAYELLFKSDIVQPINSDDRYKAKSVRLVTDVN